MVHVCLTSYKSASVFWSSCIISYLPAMYKSSSCRFRKCLAGQMLAVQTWRPEFYCQYRVWYSSSWVGILGMCYCAWFSLFWNRLTLTSGQYIQCIYGICTTYCPPRMAECVYIVNPMFHSVVGWLLQLFYHWAIFSQTCFFFFKFGERIFAI